MGLLTGYLIKQNISQINKSRLKPVLREQAEVVVELENVPVRATIRIIQHNLFETEVTTFETTSINTDGKPILGYREKYGIHGGETLFKLPTKVILIFNLRSRAQPKTLNKFASASAEGKKLTILTPYSISDDHPNT